MPNAYIGAGIAQGAADTADYIRNTEVREMQRQTARNEQQLSTMKLNEYVQNAPMRQSKQELEMQQLQAQTTQINRQALKEATIPAMERYAQDNNARHLNTWLANSKQNPVGANLYGSIARYDNLAKSDSTDRLLRSAGLNPDDVYGSDVQNDFIIVTNNDGSQSLLEKEKMFAMTGYTNYMTDQQLQQQERQARIQQLLRSGKSVKEATMTEKLVKNLMDTEGLTMTQAYERVKDIEAGSRASSDFTAIQAISEQENIGMLEAADKYYAAKNQGRGQTDQERYISAAMAENPELTREQATAEYKNLTQTTKQKETASIDADKDALDSMDFFNMDVNAMPQADRAKVQRHISNIERFTGSELSNEDKRVLRNTRSLIALGKTVSEEMTPEETGLMDRYLGNLKSYVRDEVGGKRATSAYETFRNTLRNALYGSSLTDAEIAAFESAAGSRSQKFRPVMEQFKTQIEQLKNTLVSVRDMNDPYIAQYYIGTNVDNVDDIIQAIDERIAMVDKNMIRAESTETPKPVQPVVQPTPDGTPPKRSLSEIYAEFNQ